MQVLYKKLQIAVKHNSEKNFCEIDLCRIIGLFCLVYFGTLITFTSLLIETYENMDLHG